MARRMSAHQYRSETDWEEGTCTWCRKTLEGSRTTFCSDECVQLFRADNDPAYIRAQVRDRDHGVCAKCGLNTLWLLARIQHARQLVWSNNLHPGSLGWDEIEVEVLDICLELGLEGKIKGLSSLLCGHFHVWEADHVVPVIEGGSNCLDNLQTLCLICHRKKTADWSRYRHKIS